MTDKQDQDQDTISTLSTDTTESSSCNETCTFFSETSQEKDVAYIVTWADVAPTLQGYVDAYQKSLNDNNHNDDDENDDDGNDDNNNSKRKNNEKATELRLAVFPTIKDLVSEVVLDVQTSRNVVSDSPAGLMDEMHKRHMFDGFVIPPLLSGELLQTQGVIRLDDIVESNKAHWSDILPHYRNNLSSIDIDESDDVIRFIPLFAGNQLLMVYRKDWLDILGISEPRTLSEFLYAASQLHTKPFGPNGQRIVGSCLGRLISNDFCQMQIDPHPGCSIHSMSMSYISMVMSSINQIQGSSTGWLFDNNDDRRRNSNEFLNPILEPGFDQSLWFMEQQLRFTDENQIQEDIVESLNRLRNGHCGLTITAHHPKSLLMDEQIGIAPLPGSYRVLDRRNRRLTNCTEDICPYGVNDDIWGQVNLAPFGAIDAVVGGVSSFATESNQKVIKDFMEYMLTNPNLENIPIYREQPLTYSQLAKTENPRYRSLISSITTSGNVAYPLRIPKAHDILSTLDSSAREYLVSNNYSQQHREEIRRKVQFQWQTIMENHNADLEAIPLSIFYEKSLGTYELQPGSHLYIGDFYRALGWMAGLVAISTSICLAIWVWWFKRHRVISTSQPLFLWMICAGTITMALSIFLFGVEDDIATYDGASIACMASVWLYSLGFVTTVSALFAKTWRINQIFREAHAYQRIKVEAFDVLLPFFIVFGCNIVILVVWNTIDPLRWERLTVDEFTYDDGLRLTETDTYGSCESHHKMAYFWVLFGGNAIFVILALVQTYECRKITTEYNESNWICAAATCIIQTWIFGLPIIRLTEENPRARFFVMTGIVFVTCMGTLVLLFLPKISYLHAALSKEILLKKKEEIDLRNNRKSKQIEMSPTTMKEDNNNIQQNMALQTTSEESAGGLMILRVPYFGRLLVIPNFVSNNNNTAVNNDTVVAYKTNDEYPYKKPMNDNNQAGGGGWGTSNNIQSTSTTAAAAGGGSIPSSGDAAAPNPFEGLRIIRTASRRFSEIQRMQQSVGAADEKNRELQERLESLQQRAVQQRYSYTPSRMEGSESSNSDNKHVSFALR